MSFLKKSRSRREVEGGLDAQHVVDRGIFKGQFCRIHQPKITMRGNRSADLQLFPPFSCFPRASPCDLTVAITPCQHWSQKPCAACKRRLSTRTHKECERRAAVSQRSFARFIGNFRRWAAQKGDGNLSAQALKFWYWTKSRSRSHLAHSRQPSSLSAALKLPAQ